MKWDKHQLGKVCNVKDGTHNSPKYVSEGFPLVTSKNIKDGRLSIDDANLISAEDFHEINKRSKVDKGDILMPMIGTIGNPVLVEEEPGFAIKNVCLIKRSERINERYLLFLLKSSLFEKGLLSVSRGGTQKFISLGDIRAFEIPLPPLDVQQRIADTLDVADALRRKDQELLRKYDELAQSIFYEMFGDPEHNTEGWEVQKFGLLIHNIKAGTSLGGEDRELNPGEFGVLKISAVTTGIFKPQEYKVPVQGDIVKERVTVKRGDLLFSRANTRELVGAVAIVEDTYPSLMLPDKLWRIDLHADQMLNYYCKAILTDKSVRYTLTQTATGSSGSMLNISMGKLRDLEIPVPPLDLQTEFEDVSKKLVAQKRLVEKAAAQSESLFTSLLGSYFA